MPTEVKQQLFSIAETSIIFGCSVSSTWRAIRERRLDVVYLGGSTKITGPSIDRLLAGKTPKPERLYLQKAHETAKARAYAKKAANLARKEAEAKRLLALERRKRPPGAERPRLTKAEPDA
jgi:hypothetical protein